MPAKVTMLTGLYRTRRCLPKCQLLLVHHISTLIRYRAYRMIKDDLTLDGTPTLNLASFVTTYMVCPAMSSISIQSSY